MSGLDSAAEIASLLAQWETENGSGPGVDPVPVLTRMAEIVEKETGAWYKQDPDPFDDRHPGRADPDCALGHVLKAIFKNEAFMSRMVNTYLLNRELNELHVICCRLLLGLMPGLETSVVFQENEALVRRLVNWVEVGAEPLCSYATGLLASAMEIQDIATNFKENNDVLVPMLLKRLHSLWTQDENSKKDQLGIHWERPFANIGKEKESVELSNVPSTESLNDKNGIINQGKLPKWDEDTSKLTGNKDSSAEQAGTSGASTQEKNTSEGKRKLQSDDENQKTPEEKTGIGVCNTHKRRSTRKELHLSDCSNSSWVHLEHLIIGSPAVHPLTVNVQQRLIIQYLTPMGEYQELLAHVFEYKALDLIFYFIDLNQNRDVLLAFDTLKYLASLLCHKKFAVEFIQKNGLERLLEVHRPSVAATGVSICLYYLAYFDDAMERVCLLPHAVLSEIVSYVLWLLECSHESGRCHATMFFSLSLSFRVILELFDMQDGLRKLYNVISTMTILNMDDNSATMAEDEMFTSRQGARHVCVALKKYFEAHLAIKADQIRRSHLRNEGGSPLAEIPAYKASKFPPEVIQDNVELLLECLSYRIHWEPVTNFSQLGGITLLLQLVAIAAEWSTYTGKSETIRSAIDTLIICSVTPKIQLQLCNAVLLPDNNATPSTSILLGLAEGAVLTDPDVMRASLNVVINCVCGPTSRLGGHVGRVMAGSTKKRQTVKSGEELLCKMWDCVRSNNGIMVLLKLLMIKTPITEADGIRALACKALAGLARSDTVKQIIGKLPLFNNGQLQFLMKDPVLHDKRHEHTLFCRYATDLIERVSGKPKHTNTDASMDRIRRADIVAETKILYREKELLTLIHSHLISKGFVDTAGLLQKEAELVNVNTSSLNHPASPHIYSSPSCSKSMARIMNSPMPSSSQRSTDSLSQRSTGSSQQCSSTSLMPAPPGTPLKVNRVSTKVHVHSTAFNNQTRLQQTQKIIRQKNEAFASPAILKHSDNMKKDSSISLDKIVTDYLREQHAACPNPVVTCPPFSLHEIHRCPEPRLRNSAPTNITSRVFRKSVLPRFGGPDGSKCDRKFIYSRFRPIRSYRDGDEDGCFSCAAFSSCENFLMLGTYAGELKLYNVQTGEESVSYDCHSSPVTHCQPSRDKKLVLTSSTWGTPLSAVWSMQDMFELKHGFEEDSYVEFSHHTQDRIIGTKDDTAHIYDLATGRLILTLNDQDKANNYTRNRATFNPTDDLVLNDGVLWDVNSGRAIHKFDKFNPSISGVFHPMGLEVIINSEVWDLRTFHLLHTVPGLDQCQIRFNHAGDVIYGAIHDDEENMEETAAIKSPFGSSFRTFDATDYSNIATIDVKKNIFDLCTDSADCYLAVVENQRSPETLSEESLCRLYEVGRRRDKSDQDEDDLDDEEDDDGDGDDDDDDDDDDDEDEEEEEEAQEDNDDEDGNENEEEADSDDNEEANDNEEAVDSDSDSDSDESDALISGDDDDGGDDFFENMLFELSDYSNL